MVKVLTERNQTKVETLPQYSRIPAEIELKHYHSIVEYLCRYDLTLPQYEEYLFRYDLEEHRQSWKLRRVGDFKDK